MAQASTRKQTVRYKFDALGRRVQRVAGKENTKFIYDGQDVLADDNTGTLTKYQNGPGIDNKLRAQTGSDAKYFLADHLGSTNGLTDSTGALTSQTAYDSFGNQTGSLATRYGFTGRERDDVAGLMYYRARFYDPNLGRFISEDPIGFAGGDVNLYAYVWNAPLAFSDPSGLFPNHEWWRSLAPENLGQGWRGRVDAFNNGEGFEIHVYRPSGREAGIVNGRNGWIPKHTIFDGTRPIDIPDCVVNKINGLNVTELRARGVIGPQGTQNIRGGAYLFSGRNLFGVMGGAAGVLGLMNGLVVDYDVYRRAAENNRSIWDQYEEDNADYPYVMTPFGLMRNYGYRVRG